MQYDSSGCLLFQPLCRSVEHHAEPGAIRGTVLLAGQGSGFLGICFAMGSTTTFKIQVACKVFAGNVGC